MQLVPCRWSHTGWKYVQRDPAKEHFFNSPNKVNSVGFRNPNKAGKHNRNAKYDGAKLLEAEKDFQTSYG